MPPVMHNAPADVKCLMHHDLVYLAFMMKDAGDRLKKAREKLYPSAKAAAEAMGVPVATYIQHENGSRGYPAAKAARYATFFRVSPEWLLYGTDNPGTVVELGPRLFVVGEVAAGVFKTAWQKDRDEWQSFTGRPDYIGPVNDRFGLQVVGDSMNLLYPEGTILECTYYHGREPIPSGKRVIVQRKKHDGTVEATVKELTRDPEGVEWLVPRSSNPIHRAFRGDQPDDPEIAVVEILAIVVASIRPE